MITVGMNYEVLPGKGDLFESVFNKVLKVMNELSGHKESHLFKDVHNPRRYLILSEWHSRASFDEFIRSERFRNVVNWGKEQVLAGRPRHDVYGDDEPAASAAPAARCPVHHG